MSFYKKNRFGRYGIAENIRGEWYYGKNSANSGYNTKSKTIEQRYSSIEKTLKNLLDSGTHGDRGFDYVLQLNYQIDKYISQAQKLNVSRETIKYNVDTLFDEHQASPLLEEFKEYLPAYHNFVNELSVQNGI